MCSLSNVDLEHGLTRGEVLVRGLIRHVRVPGTHLELRLLLAGATQKLAEIKPIKKIKRHTKKITKITQQLAEMKPATANRLSLSLSLALSLSLSLTYPHLLNAQGRGQVGVHSALRTVHLYLFD